MSYLYKAIFASGKIEIDTPPHLPQSDFIATVLYNTVKDFNESAANEEKDSTRYSFYIAYHPDIGFYEKNKKKVFCQYVHLRNKEDIQEDVFNGDFLWDENFERKAMTISVLKDIEPRPIIHITSLDLFDETQKLDKYYKVPRFIKLLDSSIWDLYVPILRGHEDTFNARLREQINVIIKYIEYYKLNISTERTDFRARLAYNSYLSGGDHSDNVSPFLFHSENKMKELLEEKIKEKKGLLPQEEIKWRVLIIDDHSQEALRIISGSKTGERINKKSIIRKRIDELTDAIQIQSPNVKIKRHFEIDVAESIEKAKAAITSRRYDIIFLDYLLGHDIQTQKREYGFQLLQDIKKYLNTDCKEKDEITYNKWKSAKGIYGKFWFFNISSFSYAIEERLREQGLGYYTKYWNFSRGGSPVITPELFKYELFNFLTRQIEIISELPSLPKDRTENKNTTEKSNVNTKIETRIITISDLLNKVYCSKNPRENAVKYFDSILTIKANYKILKKDFEYNQNPYDDLLPLDHFDNEGRLKEQLEKNVEKLRKIVNQAGGEMNKVSLDIVVAILLPESDDFSTDSFFYYLSSRYEELKKRDNLKESSSTYLISLLARDLGLKSSDISLVDNVQKLRDTLLEIDPNYFNKHLITHLEKKYKKINKKSNNGSLLVQSLFPDLKHYDNAFWEHLMHLVYVTAFGTIRQWPELWEEFLFVKDYLKKTDNSKGVIDKIEEYIINLKKGSY